MTKNSSFSEALAKALEGERVTRTEWNDEGIYGFFVNGVLMIRIDFKIQQWIVHEEDVKANDWYVL